MGGCASREADAASATVHAADALTPGTPAVNHKTPHAAPASLDTRAADPGRAAVARYAKRGAVGEAEHVSEAEETLESLPKAPKSAAETTLIKAAIADNILFKDLEEAELQSLLIGALQPLTVPAGEVIIQQGAANGDTFYVVNTGACDILVNGVQVATRGPGTAFGELALLYACPRAATVRARESTQLWVLHQRWYRLVTRSAAAFRLNQKVSLLRNVPFFGDLTEAQLSKVAECLAPEEHAPGAPIITKGDIGDCFYMLRSGTALVTDGPGKLLATVQQGGYFGERALLNDDVRAAHVSVAPDGESALCFVLRRDAFKAALAMVEATFRCGALSSMPLLAPLVPQQLAAAAGDMKRVEVRPGATIITKGAALDGIYILERGAFAITGAEADCTWPSQPRRGFAFGVESLLPGSAMAPATVTATSSADGTAESMCSFLHLSVSSFESLFGSLTEVTAASRMAALRRVPLLAPLPPPALLQLSREVQPLNVADGAVIVRQGDDGDCFYMLQTGCVGILDASGKEVARLHEGAYFGELALQKSDVRKATCVSRGPSNLLIMTRSSFTAMRDAFPQVASALAKGEAGYAPVAFSSRLGLKDVRLKRALGVGTFGKVWLATHKEKVYALKQIAKAQVVKKGLVQHVRRERDVMAECAGTFLVGLSASFQDGQSLYMMMELVPGGELFYYLQSLPGPLPEASARFYTACVVEAFAFLHARFYIYRDLKPENLLICANGYIKVADFSFVKRLRGGKTYTLCGTPAYLAPEQITRAGHDRGVDWWALGVLTYEMLAGISPFYHEEDMVMFRRIVEVKYSFLPPVPKMSYEAKDLVNALLQKAPHQRLPMGRLGVSALHQHLWFKGFNWDSLRDGKMKAPYVPRLKGSDDLRFFPDCTHESPGAEYGTYSSVGNFVGFES